MEWIVAEKARKQATVARLWVHATAGCKCVTKIYWFLATVIQFFTLFTKCVVKQPKVRSSWLSLFSQGEEPGRVYCLFLFQMHFSPLILIHHIIYQKGLEAVRVGIQKYIHPETAEESSFTLSDNYKFVYLVNQIFNTQGKCVCGIDKLIPETTSVFTNAAEALRLICVLTALFEISPVTHYSP